MDSDKQPDFNIGPGQYEQSSENFKVKSHNSKGFYFGKEKKLTGSKIQTGTNKFLGPNAYYPEYT